MLERICIPVILCTVVFCSPLKAAQDENQTADELAYEFYESLYPNQDYETATLVASKIKRLGESQGDHCLVARGLIRLAYAELFFGKWNEGWKQNLAECERLCRDDISLARAELHLFRGHMRGKWLGKFEEGVDDLDEAIWIANELREDLVTALAFGHGAELLVFQGFYESSRDYALRSLEIAKSIDDPIAIQWGYIYVLNALILNGNEDDARKYASLLKEHNPKNTFADWVLFKECPPESFVTQLEQEVAEAKLAPDTELKPDRVACLQARLAAVRKSQGRIEEAIALSKRAHDNHTIAGNKSCAIAMKYRLVLMGLEVGDKNVSVQQLLKLIEDSENANSIEIMPSELAILFEKIGEHKLASLWWKYAYERTKTSTSKKLLQAEKSAVSYWKSELRGRNQDALLVEQQRWTRFSYILTTILAALVLVSTTVGVTRFRTLKRSRLQLENLVDKRTLSLKQALKRSESADTAKSDFLAKVNHELRNPLAAILGYCELLNMVRGEFSSRVNEYVDGLNSSSKHLLGLVDDVLEVTQIENGKISTHCRNFKLDTLIDDVSNMVAKSASQLGLEFQCAIAAGSLNDMYGDDTKLKQILINLINNGIKFTEQGHVVVDIKNAIIDQDDVMLTAVIRDSGCGISEEFREKVLEPFVQVPNGKSREGKGLGLFITKSFVQHMGGSLELESTANEGTTVTVRIPFQRTSADTRNLPSNRDGDHRPPSKILIVDDQFVIRDVVSKQLRRIGHSVKSCQTLDETLEYIESWKPQMLLLDLRMHDNDGFDVLKAIRKHFESPPIVIAMTGDATENVRKRAIAAGFDGFITKPFQAERISDIYCSCCSFA